MKGFRILFIAFFMNNMLLIWSQQKYFTIPYDKNHNMTMRYEEVISLCKKVDSLFDEVKLDTLGFSSNGSWIPMLRVSRPNKNEKIKLFINAGIHSGESEGMDAGFLFLRDLLVNSFAQKWLDDVEVYFVPVFNVEGLQRFSPYNRINQNGPEQMGWRTNALNLNLNRDFLKADAPEMRAWLTVFHRIKPDFLVDCHTTDGADYQYTITYSLGNHPLFDDTLRNFLNAKLIPYLKDNLDKSGYLTAPYVVFRNWHNPRSGLVRDIASPHLTHGYTLMYDIPSLLVETHMLKPYELRVDGTERLLLYLTQWLIENKKEFKKKLSIAQSKDICKAEKKILPLDIEIDFKDSTMVDFLGYAYDSIKSEVTGQYYLRYNREKPETWKIPYYGKWVITSSTNLPYAYVIPAQYGELVKILSYHNIQVLTLKTNENVKCKTYYLHNVSFPTSPYEGRFQPTYEVIEKDTILEVKKGSYVVPLCQKGWRVLAYLLEPASSYSFLKWGFFNSIFEQKEYGEVYVLEPLAAEMIKDPAIKSAFENWKKQHPKASRYEQLNWFYLQSKYKDSYMNWYPILKVMEPVEYRQLIPQR